MAPAGVLDAQYQNARLFLEKWNIKRADVVNQIMQSAELVQEVNKFAYELQTGKVKVEKNVAGYLLKPVTFVNFVEIMAMLNKYWTLMEFP